MFGLLCRFKWVTITVDKDLNGETSSVFVSFYTVVQTHCYNYFLWELSYIVKMLYYTIMSCDHTQWLVAWHSANHTSASCDCDHTTRCWSHDAQPIIKAIAACDHNKHTLSVRLPLLHFHLNLQSNFFFTCGASILLTSIQIIWS